MAFHKVTEHETMGYCPRFGSVSDQPPARYQFHVLSKMNSVVKIKCLLDVPLSKHMSQVLVAAWWWECMGALASCRCPAGEGQVGLAMIYPTSSICFALGSHQTQMLSHRDWC